MATPTRVKLPVKDQRVEDLLLWRDPVKSGAALAGVTVVFYIIKYAKINVLSTLSYLGCAAVLGLFLWHMVGGFLKKPPPPVPRILKEGISDAEVTAHVQKVTPLINKGLAFGNRLASGREPVVSLATGSALYLAGKMSAHISLLGLGYMAVLAAFALPKVYEMRKDEIDAGLDTARTQATSVYDKYLHSIVSKIPKASAPASAESSSTKKAE